MTLRRIVCILVFLAVPISPMQSRAATDWHIYRTLKLEIPPIDVAVSHNGKWIFVLADGGEIHIFSNGNFLEKIKVGDHVDQIEVGPREELLLLTSKRDKTVLVLALDFVKDINVSGSPFRGPENAPVTIAVFSDFQCGYCRELLKVTEQVLDQYSEEVRIVYKNFPLKRNRISTTAAIASFAAHGQGMFWEFHDLLFNNPGQLTDKRIQEIVAELGLDQERFQKDMENPEIISMVRRDFQDGRNAGVLSVPAVFVNGKRLKNRKFEGFQALIDNALKTVENRP